MSSFLRRGDPEEVGMSPERVRHVRCLAERWVEEGETPALVVLAARRGVVVLHEAFGRSGPEPDAPPVELDTVFPMASISKAFTAALAMTLVDDGLLGLNRPVQEYVPEFVGEGKDQVMVHHLLTHTSGLGGDEEFEAELQRRDVDGIWSASLGRYPTQDGWIGEGLRAPLIRPPGVEMSYSSVGYEILGEIVQRVSGKSLEGFGRRRLFEPLGMTSTWFVVPESADYRVVRRHRDAPNSFIDSVWLRRSGFACGGVHSTASDLATFGQMLLEDGSLGGVRVLSRASAAEMKRNQIPGIGAHFGKDEYFPEAAWGFGLCIQGTKKAYYYPTLSSPLTYGHDGAGGTWLSIDPAYDLVLVYLSVQAEMPPDWRQKWNADLFVNAVTAAVLDA